MQEANTTREDKKWMSNLEKRLKVVEKPESIVVVPRTREGHILVALAFGLDRVVSRIRLRAGTYINISDVVSSLGKVNGLIKEFREFTNYLGGDGMVGPIFETPETKRTLASLRHSHVIVPRSNEGKEMAILIKRLDPALVQFRNSCTDFSKSEELFNKLMDLIDRSFALVQELSRAFGMPFRNPRDFDSFQKIIHSLKNHGEQNKEVGLVENQEEVPKKGRKIGVVA